MSKATEPDPPPRGPLETLGAIYNHFWSVFLRGVAIIVPVIVTLFLISIALSYVSRALEPFIRLLEHFGLIGQFRNTELIQFLVRLNVYEYVVDFLAELIALTILLGIILLVGSVGHNRYGERLIEVIDMAVASIPGVGTVYKSFRRMGDVMLTTEDENFQDVKLVECLGDDTYVIGFETSAAPESVSDATGHEEMLTLFIPMAPNPVTGGFLTYVSADRVHDVDMTIEDGVKSILTSGVATGKGAAKGDQLSLGDVKNVAQVDRIQDAFAEQRPGTASDGEPGGAAPDGSESGRPGSVQSDSNSSDGGQSGSSDSDGDVDELD
ncbi:hypothetical protein GCM10028857_04300 [Salinarchaeum chitinilyticum]